VTNHELESRLSDLTTRERHITAEIVTLIRVADQRRLYLERGFSSLFEWLVQSFSYSHSAAYRRVQAARLQKDIPDLADKIAAGSVNLTTLAQLQTAVKNHERAGEKVSPAQKEELITKIENKSSSETQKVLAETFPESMTPKEILRHIGNDDSILTVVLSKEERAALERVKELMAHSNPEASWAEVIGYAARFVVKAKDKTGSTHLDAAAAAQSEKSAAQVRREVLARGCEFKAWGGRKCGSRFQLEVDHIRPRALGGTDAPENLRCLCRKHNLLMAERHFGSRKMKSYWPR